MLAYLFDFRSYFIWGHALDLNLVKFGQNNSPYETDYDAKLKEGK